MSDSTELRDTIRRECTLALAALDDDNILDCVLYTRLASAAALELQRVSVGCGAPPIRP